MTKIPCETVQDLLVLYEDDVCSKQSQILIKEHIETCITCKTIFEEVQHSPPSVEVPENINEGKALIKEIKQNIFIKKVLAMAILFIIIAMVYGALFTTWHTVEIKEKDILGIYQLENGDVICQIKSPVRYGQFIPFEPRSQKEKETIGDEAYIKFSYTIFEKIKTEVFGFVSDPSVDTPWTVVFNTSQWDNDMNNIAYATKEDDNYWLIWEKGNVLEPASAELEKEAADIRKYGILASKRDTFSDISIY